MGKPGDLSQAANGDGGANETPNERSIGECSCISRLFGLKCLLVLVLGVSVFLPALFWLPPFSKFSDPEDKDLDPRFRGVGVAYASILDEGNFVLRDKTDNTLWQSFSYPTDTILPTQIIPKGTQLIARFSDGNYSHGRFKLILQTDGNFVAYTLNWPQESINYAPYYGTPWSYNIGMKLVFNNSGFVSILGNTGNVLGNVLSGPMLTTLYLYQRAILEYDGVFRMYGYPASSSANQSRNWTLLDFEPKNICNQVGDMGGGPCGFNSYCKIESDQRPKCYCPQGYSFIDETDHMKGCRRDFTAQNCFSEPDQFELQEMDATVFQGQDSESFIGMPESDCRARCLSDCLCAAVVFDQGQCWKKGFPLTNGWVGSDVRQKTYIKVGVSNSTTMFEPSQDNGRGGPYFGILAEICW